MLADADCDDETIQAVTGHKTTTMVAHYRRGADKKRRAAKGIARLDFSLDEGRTIIAFSNPGETARFKAFEADGAARRGSQRVPPAS
jgi:hypothetical protein